MNGYVPSAEEVEFLKTYDPGAWPRPSVTADLMVLAGKEEKKLLLVRRGGHPYRGFWALPGGFCEKCEPPEATASRELKEETGLDISGYRLFGIFGGPDRDPRGWTITTAFLATVNGDLTPTAADDAAETGWFVPKTEKIGETENTVIYRLTLSKAGLTLQADLEQTKGREHLPETGVKILSCSGIAFDHAKIIFAGLKIGHRS